MPEATQSSAVGALSCEDHKLLFEWAHPLSQNLVNFCICLIFDTPTHHRFLWVFCQLLWMGRKHEKVAYIDHMACDWSLCFGNLQFFRSWWVLSGVFSVSFCYICSFFFFNKNSRPLKILWLHCPHFPSPSICLHYLFCFSFIYSLVLQIKKCLICLPSRAFHFIEQGLERSLLWLLEAKTLWTDS